jgi:DNA-binding NtrC family response regulator
MGRDRATETIDRKGLVVDEGGYPCLFLAVECDRPLAGPARFVLRGFKSLEVGRGARRSTKNDGQGRLSICIPDATISSAHAVVRRAGGGWELSDLGSKNGTAVNGERCSARMLEDGDLVETGQTLFFFRRTLPGAAEPLDASALAGKPRGMATLIPRLEEDFERIRAVAKGSLTLIILGESGTGKELLACAIHTLSARPGPFVAVNCGAIPASLIASELFGCRKGAFSGAAEDRPGLIRSAEGGTLFLDEVGELPPEAQVALLRVLQEREVLPLGATRQVSIDVRFLSATSRDLANLVAEGRFRPELQARLAGFICRLPPLAERREDLGLILTDRLRAHASENVRLSVEAARALWRYSWPGNVRELDQCVHAAALLAQGARIELAHLPEALQSWLKALPPSRKPAELSEEDTQRREQVLHLLQSHAGNISAVAREMGKERKQVHRWLERYGIDPASFRR